MLKITVIKIKQDVDRQEVIIEHTKDKPPYYMLEKDGRLIVITEE